MKPQIKVTGDILTINGLHMQFSHNNGDNINIFAGSFCEWERAVIDNIINLMDIDNGDAQGITELHNDLLLQCHKEGMTPIDAALAIDAAAFIKPKNLTQCIDNILRLNTYYQETGMNSDDNYTRCVNNNLCSIAASDRPAVAVFCLDDNGPRLTGIAK